ncbi:MAG: Na/Pi cotransporter family protein [Epulopiscium sp.]|nr:Na/Pi cotransporter family protein [Candidatus Epulonipiscium sp.]
MNYGQVFITFIGGFGLFLYGMQIMAQGLQKSAGSRMKRLLGILTKNHFMGVLVGVVITGIMQSSSASTVMVVGFVNAGLMNLSQAVGVIMGANIGTTVTSWIVSSAEWMKFLAPSQMAPIAIAIGVLMMVFSKKKGVRQIGEIIAGFGILFLGLDMMGSAAKPLQGSQKLKDAFVLLGHNPLLGILAGAAVTVIIQSSSASVGILQTLAAAALVPWNAAVYIILGQNIGTCVTALMSSIGANKTAKRAAYIHLLFNVIGSIVFSIVAVVYFYFINRTIGAQMINMTDISIVHTVFNVMNTIVLFPFANWLVYLSGKMVSRADVEEDESALRHLDDRILETPSFAVENVTKEVIRMGMLAAENTHLAMQALFKKETKIIEQVFKKEKSINALEKGITNYLVKISNSPVSEEEHNYVTGLFHTINDIERVGDHAENIVELAQLHIEDSITLSEAAYAELKMMYEAAISCYEASVEARKTNNRLLAHKVLEQEERVNQMEDDLRASHIQRLANNECSATAGVVFLDVISNLERISDHASNIAMSVIDLTEKPSKHSHITQ